MRLALGLVGLAAGVGFALPVVVRWWQRRRAVDRRDQISEAWRDAYIRERRE